MDHLQPHRGGRTAGRHGKRRLGRRAHPAGRGLRSSFTGSPAGGAIAGAGGRRTGPPRWGSIEALRKEARKLIKAAGLSGSLKYLRSGSGSHYERPEPLVDDVSREM